MLRSIAIVFSLVLVLVASIAGFAAYSSPLLLRQLS